MKEIVFDHIIKVSKGFKHFLNFLKFPCGPPFASASDACGRPLWFSVKISKSFKTCFFASKVNNFMKEIVFDHMIKVSKTFKYFMNLLKFPCGPPFASGSHACGTPFRFG